MLVPESGDGNPGAQERCDGNADVFVVKRQTVLARRSCSGRSNWRWTARREGVPEHPGASRSHQDHDRSGAGEEGNRMASPVLQMIAAREGTEGLLATLESTGTNLGERQSRFTTPGRLAERTRAVVDRTYSAGSGVRGPRQNC